jgi:hypothetical protein
MQVADIQGAAPSCLTRNRKDTYDTLNYKDVNSIEVWQTSRTTDPLEPTYTVRDEAGKSLKIGAIEGSKSR